MFECCSVHKRQHPSWRQIGRCKKVLAKRIKRNFDHNFTNCILEKKSYLKKYSFSIQRKFHKASETAQRHARDIATKDQGEMKELVSAVKIAVQQLEEYTAYFVKLLGEVHKRAENLTVSVAMIFLTDPETQRCA